uniref:Cation/H+ exchanger transmembrane domain-containing protein n=1 Tax=Gasterosteus aculeatus aculeatus TaxID=481459 RepID=A0AAQ4Q4J9_GASAC
YCMNSWCFDFENGNPNLCYRYAPNTIKISNSLFANNFNRLAGINFDKTVGLSVSRVPNKALSLPKSNTCICVRDRPTGSFVLSRTLRCVAGMLLMGFMLRNIPVIKEGVYIDFKWSASLRNIALAVILARAGLGLDPTALRKLKSVCLRVASGPCILEACTTAVISHFLMDLPWVWGFILGFVLSAVSPAVVVPSMLLLQKDGYGVEQGIPTLLMAAGSFDDVLAITGFTTCLGMAFATGSTWFNLLRGVLEVAGGTVLGLVLGFLIQYFPSVDQKHLVIKRSFLVLGLSVFAVFGSGVAGFPGSGGLCTLVLAFLAGLGWGSEKAHVEEVVGWAWDIFQPLLFGLIGAEIRVLELDGLTVGLGIATLLIALLVRILFTFVCVLCAGFNMREKVFISLAWMPKATVQAAIGSTALDMARTKGDVQLQKYSMDVLTVAVLAILITAPIGALLIGLAGPLLLQKPKNSACGEQLKLNLSAFLS